MRFDPFLYCLGRVLDDLNAVKSGRVDRRIGGRAAGILTGCGLGKLSK